MKKLFLISVLFILSLFPLSAQYFLEYGGSLGVANYLGDIGGNDGTRKDFVSDMKLAKTRQALNGYVRYKIKRYIFLKSELNYLRIAGDDKLTTNVDRNARNLSFVNDMIDLNFQGQFVFFEDMDLGADYRFRLGMRCFIGTGVGFFYSEPKTRYKGEMVKLRPLQTEGVKYSAFGLSVPLTIGVHFTYKKKHRFGWELCWRKTFTDYLDDISRGYGDPSKMSPLGVELSNRTDELSIPVALANNYGYDPIMNPKNIRGKADFDNYVTMCFTYGYVIRGKSSFYKSRYSNFFIKKRRKLRTLRSKF